jgi:hypothetical protein
MAKRKNEHREAFDKYDLHGEDLAHRIIAGELKTSPTEQAYALLWLAERGHNRIKEMEGGAVSATSPETSHALELAKAAAHSHHLAARAALHSAQSQRRAAGSARIVSIVAGAAIVVAMLAIWTGGMSGHSSIAQTAESTLNVISELLGEL